MRCPGRQLWMALVAFSNALSMVRCLQLFGTLDRHDLYDLSLRFELDPILQWAVQIFPMLLKTQYLCLP